jgi:hypothetical protein
MFRDQGMTWHLECNDKKFYNKLDAIKENTSTRQPINFVTPQSYLQHDFTTRDTQTLEDLCVAQAKKLRSEYKNINLFYSGGCDSHYVFKIFFENNINIDKIIMVKSGFRSADFEIDDYALPYVKRSGIEYEIREPSQEYYTRYYLETPMATMTQNEYWHHFRLNNHFENVQNTPDDTVNIFGKEKPKLCHVDDKWYTYFLDISTTTQPGQFNFLMDDPRIYAKQCHMLIDKIELHKNKSEYNSITYNANQEFWNTGIGRYENGEDFPSKVSAHSGFWNNKDKLAVQSANPNLVTAWKRRNRRLVEQYGTEWFNQGEPALGTVGVFSKFFGLTKNEVKTVDELYPDGFKV